MDIIAITGGIGSGKSIVSEILRTLKYEVYDCDRAAKYIMDENDSLKKHLKVIFGNNVVVEENGLLKIDRPALSRIVFKDKDKLMQLNGLVHRAVIDDINMKIDRAKRKNADLYFFETAILFTSGMDRLANEIWYVTAPKDIRLLRLSKRGMTYDDANARIEAQLSEENIIAETQHRVINNDGFDPIYPKILSLLETKYNNEKRIS